MAATDPQSRKWQLTINNPQDCGLDRERLLDILSRFSLDYFALSDEIASTGTPHTHVFLYAHSNLRFSTIHNRLPTAHIEKALGTVQQNRNYIAKAGPWSGTAKAETQVEGSFYEWGTPPTEQEERSPAMTKLLQSVKEGRSTTAPRPAPTPRPEAQISPLDLPSGTPSERPDSQVRHRGVIPLMNNNGGAGNVGIGSVWSF